MVIAVTVVYVNAQDDGNYEETSDERYISFLFYDNFTNDNISGKITPGIWVKGYGETKMECFLNACESAGIFVEMAGIQIVKLGYSPNGIYDSNFHQSGWASGVWNSSITLWSSEAFSVRYMAIGHGLGRDGNVPAQPWQTPDDIKFYGGEPMAPGDGTKVIFHFYDDYRNSSAAVFAGQSNRMQLVDTGQWVAAYGDTVGDAFRDACSRMFWRDTVVAYNDLSGLFVRVWNATSGLYAFLWDGNAWMPVNLSQLELTENMYIAIGHCPGSSLTYPAPAPRQTPETMIWSL